MRIASLVPSATEMLFAIGLGDGVVAVTHECDYPTAAASLPQLTRTVVPAGLGAGEIDATVKRIVGEGGPLYELDAERLAELAPDLIVAQQVCEVCAVSYEDVVDLAARMPGRPRVLSQDPAGLDDVLDDVTRLGDATGRSADAARLRRELEQRLARVTEAVAGRPRRRVLALEWLDPPFVGGHWVPEMIERGRRRRRDRQPGREVIRAGLGAALRLWRRGRRRDAVRLRPGPVAARGE